MADDCIRRSDVLNEIHRFRGYIDEDLEYRMKFEINKISSADVVEVKHGKWVEKKGVLHPLETDGICTECGYETGFYNFFNFCPNCGADMRGPTMKFEQSEIKSVKKGEPILVLNKNVHSFEVCSAITFKKDGIYLVTVSGNKITVEKWEGR